MAASGQSQVAYTFDTANRLQQITQGTTTVQFTYDAASRRATLTLPNGIVTTYGYDNASQLVGLNYSLSSTNLGNLSYSYDSVGRRMSVTGSLARTGLPPAVSSTAYNANNQLTTWGTANLFYDANGNMTSDGTHNYTWDARNRLAKIDNGTTAAFTYDPFGRRASKNILGTGTNFLFDGVNSVQEVIGGTNTANSLTGGVDEVFQRTDSAGTRNSLRDALGSTLALTDSSGTVQTAYTFDPFGSTTTSGTASTNTFAYTGRELDAGNLSLYFYRARYYNPSLQRFISEDPIGFVGGSPNLYSYVGNNPLSGTDPTGLVIHFSNEGGIAEYNKAINYLRQDTGMAGIINDLEASSTVYNVRFNPWGDDSFDPQTNTISWDPHSGCDVSSEEGTQSAALGLGHEMAHAQHPFFGNLLALIPAGRYDNWEELRVIGGPERTAAKTLGEPTRPDHQCTSTPWNHSPTIHTPIIYPPSPPYQRPPHEMVH
jgi:RHS repeat-associated protein